jgi:hypothetical protein
MCLDFFNYNFLKIYFKNNTTETLFTHVTLLAARAHMTQQNNVVTPHALARQAFYVGTWAPLAALLHVSWQSCFAAMLLHVM